MSVPTSEQTSLQLEADRASLINVADAIQNLLLPQLTGATRDRAGECVTILARVALHLSSIASEAIDADRKQAVDAELKTLNAGEAELAALRAKLSGGTKTSRDFDPSGIQAYLQAHAQGGSDLRITEAKVLPGGRSKQTILLTQQGARDLPQRLVIRQDWASAVTGTSVVSEYALLKQVHSAGLRVPQPLLLEASSAVLGNPFILVTRMPGGPQGDIFDPPASPKLALQIAQQLGALHTFALAPFEAAGASTQAYSPDQLREGLAGFGALQSQFGLPSVAIDTAVQWLGENLHRVDGPRAMLHNDLGCHNLLIDGEDLTAILDWELAHIGNPAADLGYIRSWVEKMIPWDQFMTAYHAAGGPPVSAATLDFYTLWCGVRLYCLLLQARLGVAKGLVMDTEITYAYAHFLPRLVHRIAGELQAILGRTS